MEEKLVPKVSKKSRSQFFKKKKKTYYIKDIFPPDKWNKERIQINRVRHEQGNITTDTTKIQNIVLY